MKGGYGAAVCEEPGDIFKDKPTTIAVEESPLISEDYERPVRNRARTRVMTPEQWALIRMVEYRRRPEYHDSIARVADHIKAAPIAYFKLASLTALLCFTFSIVFYLILHTILFNPVFAVYGVLGSALSLVLATTSKRLTGGN